MTDYRNSVRLIERPSDDELSAMNFQSDLLSVYQERKSWFEQHLADFTDDQQALINHRFAECDDMISTFGDEPDMSIAYWFCAQYIDMMILYQTEA